VKEQSSEIDRQALPGRSRRVLMVAALMGVVVAVVLYMTRPAMISPLGAVLALMTCGIGLLPTLFYILRDERTVPFFPAVGLFQVFCFGLSPFLLPLAWPKAPPIEYWGGKLTLTGESIETLVLVLVGTAALVAAFFVVRRAGLGWLPVLRIRERAGGNGTVILLTGLTLAHLAYMFFPGVSRVPSIGQFLDPVGYVAFSAFLILLLKRKTRGFYTVLASLGLIAIAAARLETLNFTQMMIPCLCGVAALVYTRAYRLASVLGVLLVLSLPAYEITSTVRYTQGGFMKKAEQLFLTVDGYINGARRDGSTSATQTAVRRISHTWLFAHVVLKSPDEVPFWGGQTYKPLFTAMVPRAIWPDKPREETGGLFGKRYDLLEPTSQTSLNLPWHIETYVNFGSLGVVIGMGLIGVFLALLDKLLNAPGRRELEMGIGLGILIPLTFQDSNFSVMVGTLPQFVICLYIYFLVGQFVLRRLGMEPVPAG
jgi:hypothetical protein